MSTEMIFDAERDVEIRIEGDCYQGSKAAYYPSHGNYLPGDGREVRNFKVFLVSQNEKKQDLEITDYISDEKKQEYMSALLDYDAD